MKTVRYNRQFLLFLLLDLFLLFAKASAGSDPEIKVREIVPSLRDDKLFVSIKIENLFSQKVLGTIRSGLPAVVFVEITLQDNSGRKILRKRILQSISYNIWEESYSIERDSTIETLKTLNSVRERGSMVNNIYLLDVHHLRTGVKYAFRVRAGITPISSLQTQKLSSWLQESDETQSDIVVQERASGFKFNLSKLVSFLIGDNNRRGNSSPERAFEFRLADITK